MWFLFKRHSKRKHREQSGKDTFGIHIENRMHYKQHLFPNIAHVCSLICAFVICDIPQSKNFCIFSHRGADEPTTGATFKIFDGESDASSRESFTWEENCDREHEMHPPMLLPLCMMSKIDDFNFEMMKYALCICFPVLPVRQLVFRRKYGAGGKASWFGAASNGWLSNNNN